MAYRKPDLFNLVIYTIIALVVMFLAGVFKKADADTGDLTWTAPTKNCDGTTLTGLTGYDITYGQGRVVLPSTTLTHTVTGLSPGTWFFSIAALTATERSEFITVEKVVPATAFVISGTDVFSIIKRVDRFVLTKVGTAPAGTVCVAEQRVNNMYVIPRASVTWTGTVRPDVVVAPCQ